VVSLRLSVHIPSIVSFVAVIAACGGSGSSPAASSPDDGGAVADSATTLADGPASEVGATGDSGDSGDGSISDPGDGTPMRNACTTSYGSQLSQTHGRLDGFLVAIIPTSNHSCNGDSTHIHLQVLMHGAVYDVAVNTDTQSIERDLPIPGGAWSEGWHNPGSLDYVALGLHTASFTQATNEQAIETELASVNHISIFCTDYTDNTGCHDVHRRYAGSDGALILHPLASQAHLILFDFTNTSPF
jgi:hypothetical protein